MKMNKIIVGSVCLVMLFLVSCKENELLKSKTELVSQLLGVEKYSVEKEDNLYCVVANTTNLKTDFGLNSGAQMVSLLLYEEVYNDNFSIPTSTSFGVKYQGTDTTFFEYTLSYLAKVFFGKKIIESEISRLSNGDSDSSVYYSHEYLNGKWDKSEISWKDNSDLGIIGFEETKISFKENDVNVIAFRYILISSNEEVLFYFEPKLNKIVLIAKTDSLSK